MAGKKNKPDDMLKEYDIRGGKRGKYAKRYAAGVEVKLLPPANERGLELTLKRLQSTLKELGRLYVAMHTLSDRVLVEVGTVCLFYIGDDEAALTKPPRTTKKASKR